MSKNGKIRKRIEGCKAVYGHWQPRWPVAFASNAPRALAAILIIGVPVLLASKPPPEKLLESPSPKRVAGICLHAD